ncbi:MAG: SPOR domain-containing protein [Gammaproteobacteria bacterium]|jgi:hypothetical protein
MHRTLRSFFPRPAGSLLRRLIAVAAVGGTVQSAWAQDRIIDDIRVSRVGDTATIEIQLACAMRFQSDFSMQSSTVIEVRVAPFDNCRLLGAGGGEIRRPLNGRLAGLVEVEYEPLGTSDSLLMLRFSDGVEYSVNQQGDLRTIVITVDTAAASRRELTAAQPMQPPRAEPQQPRTVEPQPVPSRAPISPRVIAPEEVPDYMINLRSTQQAVDPTIVSQITIPSAQQLYVSRTQVDGQTWFRLRLGFFATEQDARAALESLRDQFPRAWIGRAEPEEVATAREFALGAAAEAPLPLVAAEAIEAQPESIAELRQMPAEEVSAQMEEARAAMMNGDFQRSIAIYSELQQTAGEHRADAAEFLGLAYERAGMTNQARTQYEWYLQEFPANVGIARVRQRLAGIVLAEATPVAALREPAEESRWRTGFGISQYYRRDENQFGADQESVTTLSALITDIDLSVQRRGERVDMSGRVSVSQLHDMLNDNGPGDQQRFSYAYFEVESLVRDWWLRFGRQTLHNFGVLGRFDGGRFDYAWAPERIVHLMTGYSVETTRDSLETDRPFYGAAVEFQNLIGEWDFSVFMNHQAIESIDARNAFGTEIRYSDSKRTLTSIIDYDIDYGEINTLLVLGTWRFDSGVTFSALIDERKSPILTTRNALIGQPVATIDELLLVWTEDEIRQLAVDRTARSSSLTLGVAAPLGQRFQLNFDYTSTELTGTVESGGVAAIEPTGAQHFYSTSLVGNGLFGGNDVSIFNVRIGRSDQFQSTTFTWDSRFPIGRRVRLNPRIRYNSWEGLLNGRQRDSISPTLRVLFNTRRHYRVELEFGVDRETRVDGIVEREASGNFVNLGYRANF